jgi:hypothetical protein
LRGAAGRPKEMDFHWFNKVSVISRKSWNRQNVVLLTVFHFFWSFWTNAQTAKPCFTNEIPFLLVIFIPFSASRRQKKWIFVVFIRVWRLRGAAGRPKEMDFHWFYKVSVISRKSWNRQNVVLLTVFHFFWSFWTNAQTAKPCFTNEIPFLLVIFIPFSASRRQKKWIFVVFIRVWRLRGAAGRPKEMDFHWFYKVSVISRNSWNRQNVVLLMVFHFFWWIRAHPQTAKPCFTNGIPFLLVIFMSFWGLATPKEMDFHCVYKGLPFAGGCLATKRNGFPLVL